MFLEAYGVDTEAAFEVLGGGLAGSKVLEQKRTNMLGRSFEPGLPHRPAPQGHGHRHRPPRVKPASCMPLGAVAAQLMASARANGDGGLDHSALLRGVERLSGVTTDDPRQREQRTDMARMTAAQAAVEILKKEGVTHVFGLPGAAINPFYKAMETNGGLHHTLARHVEGASHMAEGYTRASGQHRRLHRHQRPGRHRHDHRALLGERRLDPDPVHHRPGAGRQAAQGGLPGRRHRDDRRVADQDGGHRAGGRPGPRARSSRPSTSCAPAGPARC